jgi:FkbM family methyltransferase
MNHVKDYTKGSGIFIQVGAGAGDLDSRANYNDGFTKFIKSLSRDRIKKIILVEPNPLNIPALKKCWKDYPESVIYTKAVVPSYTDICNIEFFYCPKDAPHYQVASIRKDHIEKHYGVGCEIVSHIVKTITLENLIQESIGSDEIELLSLDIEGIDADVLLDINFHKVNVKFLSFEYAHLGSKTRLVQQYISDNKFKYIGIGADYNGLDSLYERID